MIRLTPHPAFGHPLPPGEGEARPARMSAKTFPSPRVRRSHEGLPASPSPRGRRWRVAPDEGLRAFAIALLLLLTLSANAATYAGRALADALHDLQSRGLKLVYTDDVVRPEMRVRNEPRATEPRRILDELLREHALCTSKGPRNSIVIIRCPAIRQPGATAQPRTTAPPQPLLAQITVTPSQFTLLAETPESRTFLDRDEVRRLPHFADDLYRAINRVPGTAANDVSASFNLRGGDQDEVQVILDGAEIYDPFHVKDLYRAFSTIDAEAVGAVDILSGGYPVEYGGRMSGVVDVKSLAPEATKSELGISLLNVRGLTQGTFGGGRGSWVLSARYGYLREVLELLDDIADIDPRYDDLLGKVQWTLGTRGVISAHVMSAHDRLQLDEQPGSKALATYRDSYAWLNARGSLTPKLFAQSVLSLASLQRKRDGGYDDGIGRATGQLTERRDARIVAWKNDATLDLSTRNLLKVGFTAKHASAKLDVDGRSHVEFSSFELGAPPRDVVRSVHVTPSGNEWSVYAADRVRLSERVVIEGGLRASSESYTPDGVHLDPRLHVAWAPTASTAVRVAWGIVHQAPRIDELQVEDGITAYGDAQRSVHRIIGVEQRLPRGMHARLELYDKAIDSPRARYENLFDGLLLFPELRADRVRIAPDRGRARGAELLVRTDSARPLSGWISYTNASVTDEFDGESVPRAWDQRHAATFTVNYRRGNVWNFNLAGTWHTGWPATPISARLQNGRVVTSLAARNSERLPSYHRVDLRATRTVANFDFFVELFNVLNHANVSRTDRFDFNVAADGAVTPIRVTESILGVVPSFGVTWRF